VTTDPTERRVSQRGNYTWAIDEMQYIPPPPGLRTRLAAARPRRISVIEPVAQDHGQLGRDPNVKRRPVGRGSGARIKPLEFGPPGKET
jgi:hypothetical protein